MLKKDNNYNAAQLRHGRILIGLVITLSIQSALADVVVYEYQDPQTKGVAFSLGKSAVVAQKNYERHHICVRHPKYSCMPVARCASGWLAHVYTPNGTVYGWACGARSMDAALKIAASRCVKLDPTCLAAAKAYAIFDDRTVGPRQTPLECSDYRKMQFKDFNINDGKYTESFNCQ